MQPIKKAHKRIALYTASGCIALLILLSFQRCDKIDPPIKAEEEEDAIIAEMDFREPGGGSSGGAQQIAEKPESSAAPQNNNPKPANPEPESQTQQEESPVQETQSSETSSDADQQGTSQQPANDFSNIFGPGSGQDGGDGNGSGSGSVSGPGSGDEEGSGNGVGDGKYRIAIKKPSFKNPVQQIGNVRVVLTVRRDGTVKSVKVDRNHSLTTATSELQFSTAKEQAKKYLFDEDYDGPYDLVRIPIVVKYTLN